MKLSKQTAFSIVLLLIIFLAAEFSSFVVVTRILRDHGLYYFSEDVPEFATIQENWHPTFGWPNPSALGPPGRDPAGARHNPGFPSPADSCLSAYGESVVLDYRVTDEEAWTNLLSTKLGCRVANFGVASFGIDQTLLRFRTNTIDTAPVVLLGFSTAALPRQVNQFRALLPFAGRERDRAGLKPRFRLDDSNELQLIPAPLHPVTEENYQQLIDQPEQFLVDDYFQVNGPTGLSRPGFPYTLSLAGGITRLAERYQRRGEAWYVRFYAPDHPAQAVELTVRLLQAFAEESLAANRRPLVIIFPTANDLQAAGDGQNWPYQPLLNQLDATGLNYLNMGPALLKATAGGDLCEYFDADCGSHFSASGSELVAGLVHAWLKTTGDPAFSIATNPN